MDGERGDPVPPLLLQAASPAITARTRDDETTPFDDWILAHAASPRWKLPMRVGSRAVPPQAFLGQRVSDPLTRRGPLGRSPACVPTEDPAGLLARDPAVGIGDVVDPWHRLRERQLGGLRCGVDVHGARPDGPRSRYPGRRTGRSAGRSPRGAPEHLALEAEDAGHRPAVGRVVSESSGSSSRWGAALRVDEGDALGDRALAPACTAAATRLRVPSSRRRALRTRASVMGPASSANGNR